MNADPFSNKDKNSELADLLAWLDSDESTAQNQILASSDSKKNSAYEILDQMNQAALIPIPKGHKGPRISGWQNKTYKDMTPEYLAQFDADINIGVVLGKASNNLVSIDADTDDGLKEFQSLNPSISASYTTKGSRGGNIWFRIQDTYPQSCKITTLDGKPWGEFRADGMQTVIHGTHPTGIKYTWNGNPPLTANFSEINFPAGLKLPWESKKQDVLPQTTPIEQIESSSITKRAKAYIEAMPPAIEGQGGDSATFNVAKKLVHDFGLSVQDALPLMCEYNARCIPPWNERDLLYKLTKAADLTTTPTPKGSLADQSQTKKSAVDLKEEIEKNKLELMESIKNCTMKSSNLKNFKIPPRMSIVGEWFKEYDLGFIHARRGLGKTWFSLNLATAIANNTGFGPWQTHAQLPVLYVDGEMAFESILQRIEAMGASDNLYVLNHQSLFHDKRKTLNLADPTAQEAITSLCLEKGIKVVILDNLSCLFSGIKENDNDAWEVVLPWLLLMRNHGISVVIVAHSGRDGKNMRGASRREDAATFIVRLEDVDDASESSIGARFVSVFTKNRNDPTDERRYEWKFEPCVENQILITHKEADGIMVLVNWVKTGLTSASDISDEMGISKGQVSKMAKKAIEIGLLVKAGRGYSIP
jgi:putative DNA primase/helicase